MKNDQELILNVCKVIKEGGGCRFFSFQSNLAADRNSWFLSSRILGQMEADITALEFPHLLIYRPGLLKVPKALEGEQAKEQPIATFLSPLINLITNGRFAIPVETAAKAMLMDIVETATADARGEHKAAVKVVSNRAMADSVKLAGRV